MTKNVTLSQKFKKPVPMSFVSRGGEMPLNIEYLAQSRYIQWNFEVITATNLEDMGLQSSPNREPHRSSSLMVCIRGWQPCSAQPSKWPSGPWWCLHQHHNIVPQAMFQVIKKDRFHIHNIVIAKKDLVQKRTKIMRFYNSDDDEKS